MQEVHSHEYESNDWQSELLASYTSVGELAEAGLIANDGKLADVSSAYRIRVPRYYAGLIDATDPACPIRAQAVPTAGEADTALPDWAKEWSLQAFGRPVPWTADAIGDLAKLAAPRLTHRYGNRAILHATSLCALYCRFCFRKSHLNDAERKLYDGELQPALDYLRRHHEICELILTGGDPLSMNDGWLDRLLAKLETIPQLTHVRIHSRMAATLPNRLTGDLAAMLANRRFVVSLVSHFNHPKELTDIARKRLRAMRTRGIPLYNQTVLLKGVNARAEVLGELFQRLYEDGVTPFYLHHPDWTPGTFHFRTSIARGQQLMRELQGRLSGPALPHYVLDMPGGGGKIPLTGSAIELLETKASDGVAGALYRVSLSHTREGSDLHALYAEFWKDGAEDPAQRVEAALL